MSPCHTYRALEPHAATLRFLRPMDARGMPLGSLLVAAGCAVPTYPAGRRHTAPPVSPEGALPRATGRL